MPGTDLSPPGQYQLQLPTFEGPLDLLLQLVERNSLPITEVSLAEVTEIYLRRVKAMQSPPEEVSHFLTVAARLLLLKSRSLLPAVSAEAPEPSSVDLVEQLRLYQRFKRAASALRERERCASYARVVQPAPRTSATLLSLPPAALERAMKRVLARMELRMREGPSVPRVRLRLSDVLRTAEVALGRDGSVTLDRLAGAGSGRGEHVVAFLAALELIRRRRARATQESLFGPVILYAADDGGSSSIVDRHP